MLKKKVLAVLSLSSVMIMSVPFMSSSGAQWEQDSLGWKYAQDDGTFSAGGWEQIAGKWYYFICRQLYADGVAADR